MGIKEVLDKLSGSSQNTQESQEPRKKLSAEELELLSYEQEDYRDEIKSKLLKKRADKFNQFMKGQTNAAARDMKELKENQKKLFSPFKEPKMQRDLKAYRKHLNKNKREDALIKALKKLKKSKKKKKQKTSNLADRVEKLISNKPKKLKTHYTYGAPQGMITSKDTTLSARSPFTNKSKPKKPKSILNAKNSFFH